MRQKGRAAEQENLRHQGLWLREKGYSVSQVGWIPGCGHSAETKLVQRWGQRVECEYLTAYAPELIPVEYPWSRTKSS